MVLGKGKPGRDLNQSKTPEGVEVKAGNLWLSDSGNNRVIKYVVDWKWPQSTWLYPDILLIFLISAANLPIAKSLW